MGLPKIWQPLIFKAVIILSKERIMIGLSGGVDSSVSAHLLLEKGYEVAGVTLLLCQGAEDTNSVDAKAVCDRLGIKHFVFDLQKEFSDFVIFDFTSQYINGKTPNPCLECNKHIKFGEMIKIAEENGYDKIATGHYARIKEENGRYLLLRAKDLSKDQSYVLYMLTQDKLSKSVFPLGEYEKSEIREIAQDNGFINANRPDSQDICFVPDGDYASFIEENTGFVSQEGDYVDINGNLLGKHKGVIHYTLGQRKGLGIALGKPQFVIDKNSETNCVILGDEEHLFSKEVIVKNVNFIPFDNLEGEMRVEAKLRYRHNAQPAVISPLEGGMVKILFDEPQRAASPGQAAVFYDGEIVVGGGIIV